MNEMKDIKWQSDIRQTVEELVRERKREKLLAEAWELRKGTKNIGIRASELIREDRDAKASAAAHSLVREPKTTK